MPKPLEKPLLEALKTTEIKYRKCLKVCRQQCTENAVHDLRTTARRILAIIDFYRQLSPDRRLNKIRQTLKFQLDQFDELRDTQVMLLEIESKLQALPELAAFHLYLQQQEQKLLPKTAAFIKTIKQGRLNRKLKKARNRCKQSSRKQVDLMASMLTVIDKVFAIVLSRYAAIDPLNPSSIHHFRISMKKLRYILNAARPLLPDYPETQTAHLKSYLTLLGDIQNSSVLFRALEGFFDTAVPAELAHFYRKQQQELIADFIVQKNKVFEFWRKNPEDVLPWELKI